MMKLEEGNALLLEVANRPKALTVDECINNPIPRAIFTIAVSLAMGNAADAVEIISVGFIMSKIGSISTYEKEFLSAAVFMGMLVGGVACGYLSDIVGRKPCLQCSLVLNAMAGLASAAAPSVEVLIACRVIGGIGIGGSVPVVFSIGAEIFPDVVRGKYLSLIASFWMVGAIYTAFTAWIMLGDNYYGNKIMVGVNWRWFAIVSAIPAVVALALAHYIVPESPRFLMSKGRYAQAAMVLNRISTVRIEAADLMDHSEHRHLDDETTVNKINNSNNDGIVFQRSTATAKETKDRSLNGNEILLDNPTGLDEKEKASTLSLLFQGQLLPTSLTLLAIWFLLSFGSYGMSTWISTLFEDVGIGNPYAATFIFALANLPGNIISMMYIEVVGRRWLLSVGMCLAGASSLGFAFNTSVAVVVVLCASMFNCFSIVGWNSLDCLSGIQYVTLLSYWRPLAFLCILSIYLI